MRARYKSVKELEVYLPAAIAACRSEMLNSSSSNGGTDGEGAAGSDCTRAPASAGSTAAPIPVSALVLRNLRRGVSCLLMSVSLFQILVEPCDDTVEPVFQMLLLFQPMSLSGIHHQFAGNAITLECAIECLALTQRIDDVRFALQD